MPSAVSRHVELAIDILVEVSSLLGAAPIPIVDGVLRLLRVVLDIREDMRHCKHEWDHVMLAISQIQRIVLAYKERVEITGDAMPSYMEDNLRVLLQHIKQVLVTFNKYESQGYLGRVLLRHRSRRDVRHCANIMRGTVSLFNMRLNVEHASLIQSMQSQITTLTAQASMIQTLQSQISSLSEHTAVSASSLDFKANGASSAFNKLDSGLKGRVLEAIMDEANEIMSEDGDGGTVQSEDEDDPVLDWLGYLSFAEDI